MPSVSAPQVTGDDVNNVLTSCILLNARSLRNKIPELHMLLQVVKPQIAFITESWLDSSITDGLIDPSGSYVVYRHDRLHRVGGGVMALVSVSVHSYQIKIPQQFSHIEAEW